MTLTEAVRGWLLGCPLLEGETLRVDFLPPEDGGISLDVEPAEPLLRRYRDGQEKRQFVFTLATRTPYGAPVRQQLDNLGFFEAFEAWLAAAEPPELGEGRLAERVRVTTSGYVYAPDSNLARYQIRCRLSYYEKGEK